jgi:NADPH:quinone reductase-like Zn-dependent oxidoreductase
MKAIIVRDRAAGTAGMKLVERPEPKVAINDVVAQVHASAWQGLFEHGRLRAGAAVDFVVEADRAQLSQIVQRVRDGRLRTNIGTVATLDDAVAAFNSTARRPGKTVIRVRDGRTAIGRARSAS